MSAAPALAPVPEGVDTDPTLYVKLAQVVDEVSEVAKDARNAHFNYDYTSAEAMLRALRGPLSSRNIVLLSSVTQVDDREYQTAGGKASVITTVHIDFTFVCGDTGAMHKCSWSGRGDDNADKGLSKAYTNAIKTFLREQFLIPQGDDPEADTATDARAADRAPATRSDSAAPGVASEKQQNLIRARAREKGLDARALSALLRTVGGGEPKAFDAPESAEQDVDKLLARFPWRLMDNALTAIADAQEEIPF